MVKLCSLYFLFYFLFSLQFGLGSKNYSCWWHNFSVLKIFPSRLSCIYKKKNIVSNMFVYVTLYNFSFSLQKPIKSVVSVVVVLVQEGGEK